MKKLIILCLLYLVASPAFTQVSLNVNLLYQWNDTNITINFRDARYSDVWGFVQNGREYAAIGSTYGVHVFDVTNPSTTYQADSVAGAVQGFTVNHRDYKDYDGYLYAVCDEGPSTLQIFDLSFLPDSISKVYDSDSLFFKTHTIFIDTSSARLYACGTNSNALSIYSIANPSSPQLLSHYNGVPYVHDIFVRNDTAYMNCGTGLYVADFQNPSSPIPLNSLTAYADQGYNHSGWLNTAGDVYVFCDETYGKEVKVCDVSILGVQIQSTLSSGVSDSSVAHNAFIKDDFVYIDYYNDGLQIFDISNPLFPVKTGYYDTFLPLQEDDFRGAWGVYPFLPSGTVLLSDRNTGLYVFDVSQAIVGVSEIKNDVKNISIYPNPSIDNISIAFENSEKENFTLSITNIEGQLVKTIENIYSNKIELKRGNLASGVYFVQLQSAKKTLVGKLIIE
ncbi:MAG: choice-of-anchor B family protein [Flavobacteriales bacterium]|nr:choice-of-anchor B family protein [Flavobacteriales bacterium]